MFTLTAEMAREQSLENVKRYINQKESILKRIDSAINHAVQLGLMYTSYQLFSNEYLAFGEDIEFMLDFAGYAYMRCGSVEDGIITYLISWDDKPIIPKEYTQGE